MSERTWDEDDLGKIHDACYDGEWDDEWVKEKTYNNKEQMMDIEYEVDKEIDNFEDVETFSVIEYHSYCRIHTYRRRRTIEPVNPCPKCGNELEAQNRGGVKCPKPGCGYWFCF